MSYVYIHLDCDAEVIITYNDVRSEVNIYTHTTDHRMIKRSQHAYHYRYGQDIHEWFAPESEAIRIFKSLCAKFNNNFEITWAELGAKFINSQIQQA